MNCFDLAEFLASLTTFEEQQVLEAIRTATTPDFQAEAHAKLARDYEKQGSHQRAKEVTELNRRHGWPVQDHAEITRSHTLLGSHPYLSNPGLWEMATRKISLNAFEAAAGADDGIFGDHLQPFLILATRDPDLLWVTRELFAETRLPSRRGFIACAARAS